MDENLRYPQTSIQREIVQPFFYKNDRNPSPSPFKKKGIETYSIFTQDGGFHLNRSNRFLVKREPEIR